MATELLVEVFGEPIVVDTSQLDEQRRRECESLLETFASATGIRRGHEHSVTLTPEDSADDLVSRIKEKCSYAAVIANTEPLWLINALVFSGDGKRAHVVPLPEDMMGIRGTPFDDPDAGKLIAAGPVALAPTGMLYTGLASLNVTADSETTPNTFAPGSLKFEAAELPCAESADSSDQRQSPLGVVARAALGATLDASKLRRPLATILGLVNSSGAITEMYIDSAGSLSIQFPDSMTNDSGGPPAFDNATHSPRFWRAPYADAIRTGDGFGALLLLSSGRRPKVRVLDEREALVWAAASGLSAGEIASDISRSTSALPMSRNLDSVAEVVYALEDQGLLTREPTWMIREDVAWTALPDRVVAVTTDVTGLSRPAIPLALEGNAANIWHAFGENHRVLEAEIIARSAAAADIDPALIASDVRAFLQTLRESQLVEIA